MTQPGDLFFAEDLHPGGCVRGVVAVAAHIEHKEVHVGVAELSGDPIELADLNGSRPEGFEAALGDGAGGAALSTVGGAKVGFAPSGVVWDTLQ